MPHVQKASRDKARLATLQPFLGKLLEQFHSTHWLASDPIQYAHRYSKPDDREVSAFIAACFAYGSVKLVHRAVEAVLAPMNPGPADFVRSFDGVSRWSGFCHRFHREEHVTVLISVLQRALVNYGSIGELFRQGALAGDGPVCERALDRAAAWFRGQSLDDLRVRGRMDLAPGMKFFFNAPSDGSACKRMTMFLRWMVRCDAIDLGLWRWMSPADLVVPADTHVARISYYLGLRRGKELDPPSWRMAREITECLKILEPHDPVRYDFALARLGILDICKRTYAKSVCERCPVEAGCRYSNINKRIR